MWYQFFKTTLFAPLVRGGVRPRLVGVENIPDGGPVILASNHLSAAETLLIPASIRRQLTFPAKAELFKGDRGPGSKVVAWFLTAVGQVPIDRTGGSRSAQGLEPVLNVLEQGGMVGIFPEGTRSPDGRLYKGKTGVARMAVESGALVLPVGTVGTEIVKNKLGVPTVRRPVIIFGQPLDFSAYRGASDQKTLRWITDQIMAAIQQLTGQQYVDVYAQRVKHGDLVGVDVSDRVRERPGSAGAPPVPMADRDQPVAAPAGEAK